MTSELTKQHAPEFVAYETLRIANETAISPDWAAEDAAYNALVKAIYAAEEKVEAVKARLTEDQILSCEINAYDTILEAGLYLEGDASRLVQARIFYGTSHEFI